MPLVRTTMNPTTEIYVSDAAADDMAAQGVLLEGTRATTDEGLTAAAIRQVQLGALAPETRAAVEASERRAADERARQRPRKASAPRKPRARRERNPQAEVEVTHADGRVETVTGVLPASAAVDAPPDGGPAPTDTSGDVPADDATTQES